MPNLRDYVDRARHGAQSSMQTIGVYITTFLDSFKTRSNRPRRRSSRARGRQNHILGPPHLQRTHNYHDHGSNRHNLASSFFDSNRCGERNLWAALMSLLVIATLSAAIAQPKWFRIRGGRCDRVYIGLQEFYNEPFTFISHNYGLSDSVDVNSLNQHERQKMKLPYTKREADILSNSLLNNGTIHQRKEMINRDSYGNLYPSISMRSGRTHISCLTPEIADLQKAIIILCFSSLLLNLFQFFLDTLGTRRKYLELMRRHALANLLSVVSCIFTLGIAYLVADLLEREQRRRVNRTHFLSAISDHPSNVEIHFEISFYLISLAGLLGLIAAACNLLAKPDPYFFSSSLHFSSPHDSEANNLLGETISTRWQSPPPATLSSLVPSTMNPPHPPPYSP